MQHEVHDYGFIVGDVVSHLNDNAALGVVTELDADYDLGGVTTCRVLWGVLSLQEAQAIPRNEHDIQWTNKLHRESLCAS